MLYWSVQVKPAKGDYYTSSLSLLLSDAAVAGLLRRGALTQSEADCLANPELPATQRHSAVIEWIMVRIISARREGVVLGDAGFEQVFLDKACLLRAVCATLPDDRDARMPLAYVHFVQVTVGAQRWFCRGGVGGTGACVHFVQVPQGEGGTLLYFCAGRGGCK